MDLITMNITMTISIDGFVIKPLLTVPEPEPVPLPVYSANNIQLVSNLQHIRK